MSQILTCILLENAGREHLPTKGFKVSPDIAMLGFLVNSFGFYIKRHHFHTQQDKENLFAKTTKIWLQLAGVADYD